MSSGTKHTMEELLRRKAKKITNPAGREVRILEDAEATALANHCRSSLHAVYEKAMALGICPYRYLRNRDIVSIEEQLRLAKSRVVVIGAGGLGGHVVLLLARMGIGHLIVVDYDRFDETNLNRQALSTSASLGRSKSQTAVEAIGAINPGVEATPYEIKLDAANAFQILDGADAVVDALDNVPDRLLLEKATKKLGIPLVHGALAGFEGQVMTIFPEDPGLRYLYGKGGSRIDKSKSPESVMGVPTFTPALIATLQAMEVLKIILGRGRIFRNAMLYVDMETGRISEFSFENR
ncbi:MAG: HesA/MoeB/ThiF family protein [Desulfatiglandaceae bacterium]